MPSDVAVCTVRLPFASFLPIARDGPVLDPPPKPIRPEHITSLSLVCRSIGPQDQEGPFEFVIAGIDGSPLVPPSIALPKGRRPSAGSNEGSTGSAGGTGWAAWFLHLFKRLTGRTGKERKTEK